MSVNRRSSCLTSLLLAYSNTSCGVMGAPRRDPVLQYKRRWYGGRMKLEGKNALVTGSDQGIGQAIAIRLAAEGANVVVNYRKNREGADETCKRIESLGRRGVAVQADVGKAGEAARLVADAVAALGS